MDIWHAVWLTQFIMVFIINTFTLAVFARSRHLRRRNTYLIMNLTVADLLIAAVSGPETILFFKRNTRPKKGFGVLYLIISDMCWIASLGNLVLISLERLHATLYPFRHCLVGKSIYYNIIIFSWLGECLGHNRKPRERRPVKTRAPPSWLLSMSRTNELSTKPF